MAATSMLVRYEDPFEVQDRAAVVGFLAGYAGNTRVSYTTDRRLFAAWCADNRLRLLEVRRSHLEMFARDMEQAGVTAGSSASFPHLTTRRTSTVLSPCRTGVLAPPSVYPLVGVLAPRCRQHRPSEVLSSGRDRA